MKTVQLTHRLPDAEIAPLEQRFLDHQHYDRLIAGEPTRVLKPNGDPLLVLVPNAFAPDLCAHTFRALDPIDVLSLNRGSAAGAIEPNDPRLGKADVPVSATRYRKRKADGSLSRTLYAAPARSGILGFVDRSARLPFCRQSVLGARHANLLAEAAPFLQQASARFADYVPDRWAVQHDFAAHTTPDFVLPRTVFTSLTLNRDFRTACHTDQGDLREGFGVIAVLAKGDYHGGELIFPQYRIAVDIRHGDLLLADVHEAHANGPLHGTFGEFTRLSIVCYYRARMYECGTAAQEFAGEQQAADRRTRRALDAHLPAWVTEPTEPDFSDPIGTHDVEVQ